MALTQLVDLPDEPKKSFMQKLGPLGSAIGGLIGLAVGGAAGPTAAQAAQGMGAAGAAVSGFQTGSGIGATLGSVGQLADTGGYSKQAHNVPTTETAAERRFGNDPNATLAQLHEGQAALAQEDAQTRAAYEPFLNAAIQAQKGRVV